MSVDANTTWLDRAIGYFAPRAGLRRQHARTMARRQRFAGDVLQRHYEGAATGRRTQGWHRSIGDVNATSGPYLSKLRDVARDLVRNNPYAESALATIVDHTVGTGIVAKPKTPNRRALQAWNAWANTTACDADGRHDLAGLQKLVLRTVAEAGEVLVRRRTRLPTDGLPIPLQLQVLEPDYLDTSKHIPQLPSGGRIVYGVELDAIGRTVAYWLFKEHPGDSLNASAESVRVPAEGVRHIFKPLRPGQRRGVSWYAPVLLRFKDFDEFEDATLLKQKIAACLAVIVTDVDGGKAALGEGDDTKEPAEDSLSPGAIINSAPGRSITVVDPPTVAEYPQYVQTTLRAIATGLGVTYEDLTGDYTNLPFSAARMSRIRHWSRVEDWRWRLLIPQFCDPVWRWAMEAAGVMGLEEIPEAQWTAPGMPMIEPDKEGLAAQRNIRTGITTLSEEIRARGYDPEELLEEYAGDMKRLDSLGLTLDCDARKITQQGQVQAQPKPQETGDARD